MKLLYRKTIISAAILLMVPLLFGLLEWNNLPDQIPIHFNWVGQPDQYTSKSIFLVGYALLAALFQSVCMLPVTAKSEHQTQDAIPASAIKFILLLIPIIGNGVMFAIYAYIQNQNIHVENLIVGGCGLILVVLSNYANKTGLNPFFGCRLPWILDNPQAWKKTNHVASWCGAAAGIGITACAFSRYPMLSVVFVLINLFIPLVYSLQFIKRR